MTQPLLQAADLRGAARLTTDAVAGLASLVEAVHARIAHPLHEAAAGAPERTAGLTGLVYQTVRGVTRGVGGGADALLRMLAPLLPAADPHRAPRPEREALVSALNGLLGDHLAATANPLAMAMALRHAGQPLQLERFALRSRLADATPRLLVLLHGLCMNDLQWLRSGHDHGQALCSDLGYTPVYLHYNTGLSVSTNGRMLAQALEHLLDAWPVPLERLVLLGHSMGGLVARSAIHHGALGGRYRLRWPARVDDLVCLGTPHLGAPLEAAAQGLDGLLGALPFAAPLARLSRLRSAGIHDLRLGRIVGAPAAEDGPARGATVGLPFGVRCHAVAACLGPAADSVPSRALGDGLVPVASALGRHRDPDRRLAFEPDRVALVGGTGHLDLLSSTEVYAHLLRWLR